METTLQNTKRQTTEKEIIVLKAIKRMLQADDAKGFKKLLKEMYMVCMCSDHYNDNQERENLVCHFEYIEDMFEDLNEIGGFNGILPEEHYVTQNK